MLKPPRLINPKIVSFKTSKPAACCGQPSRAFALPAKIVWLQKAKPVYCTGSRTSARTTSFSS